MSAVAVVGVAETAVTTALIAAASSCGSSIITFSSSRSSNPASMNQADNYGSSALGFVRPETFSVLQKDLMFFFVFVLFLQIYRAMIKLFAQEYVIRPNTLNEVVWTLQRDFNKGIW